MNPLLRTLLQSLAAALLMTPSLAAAQSPTRYASRAFTVPSVGDEVRVAYDSNRNGSLMRNYRGIVRGTLKMISDGYLIIESRSGTVVVAMSSVRGIQRRIGTKPASAPAMAVGSAAGFLAGYLLGSLTYSADVSSTSSASNNGLAVGVLIGAPAGALVAWLASRSRPLYEDMSLGSAVPTVAVSPSGRVGFSISLATP
jgi:hypothetical protein